MADDQSELIVRIECARNHVHESARVSVRGSRTAWRKAARPSLREVIGHSKIGFASNIRVSLFWPCEIATSWRRVAAAKGTAANAVTCVARKPRHASNHGGAPHPCNASRRASSTPPTLHPSTPAARPLPSVPCSCWFSVVTRLACVAPSHRRRDERHDDPKQITSCGRSGVLGATVFDLWCLAVGL
jgi:hypothetical protein